ncbi:LPS export ABC transporter permease LptG [Betaproteobacteria bacterium]|nr:LPS export ABC transporter permease LptG [Betaproteobacteria bacterium]
MTLITKYLVSDLLRKVFVITFGFTVLFSFFSFIAELENLNSYEIKLENIFYSQILNAPSIIYDVIPIATLIGSLWCFASLAANSEFVVFFGSGFSTRHFIKVIITGGIPLVILTIFLSEFVMPYSVSKLSQVKSGGGLHQTIELQTGYWIRDVLNYKKIENDANERIINIGQIGFDRKLSSVLVYEFDKQNKLIRKITSKSGFFQKNNVADEGVFSYSWNLTEPTILDVSEPMSIAEKQVDNVILSTNITESTFYALTINPEKMSARELSSYATYLEDSNQDANSYKILFWKRIVYPLLIWIMLLIATPAAFIQTRGGNIGIKIFVGVLFGIFFHLLNGLVSHLGVLNTWAPSVIAFFPPISALIIGLLLLVQSQRFALLK